jgi:hypothetical protein
MPGLRAIDGLVFHAPDKSGFAREDMPARARKIASGDYIARCGLSASRGSRKNAGLKKNARPHPNPLPKYTARRKHKSKCVALPGSLN